MLIKKNVESFESVVEGVFDGVYIEALEINTEESLMAHKDDIHTAYPFSVSDVMVKMYQIGEIKPVLWIKDFVCPVEKRRTANSYERLSRLLYRFAKGNVVIFNSMALIRDFKTEPSVEEITNFLDKEETLISRVNFVNVNNLVGDYECFTRPYLYKNSTGTKIMDEIEKRFGNKQTKKEETIVDKIGGIDVNGHIIELDLSALSDIEKAKMCHALTMISEYQARNNQVEAEKKARENQTFNIEKLYKQLVGEDSDISYPKINKVLSKNRRKINELAKRYIDRVNFEELDYAVTDYLDIETLNDDEISVFIVKAIQQVLDARDNLIRHQMFAMTEQIQLRSSLGEFNGVPSDVVYHTIASEFQRAEQEENQL